MRKSNMRYNMVGERYGRLTVDHLHCRGGNGKKLLWACKCDCGNMVYLSRHALVSGQTKSCGCLRRDLLSEKEYKHGLTDSRLYCAWVHMIQRCENNKNKNYAEYGGRNIKVCDEWHDSTTFIKWALANGYSDNLTLDRIDVNGNYEPSNCRWITVKEQGRNKRNNIYITYEGETRCLSEWCELKGLPYDRTQRRYYIGYPIDVVFKKERLTKDDRVTKTNPRKLLRT